MALINDQLRSRDEYDAAHAWTDWMEEARDKHEQNVEMFSGGAGLVFYRMLRDIMAGETLFVWYSEEMARQAEVPILNLANIQGG